MASVLKELRERRKSVAATQKITRAMELIASSRILRAERKAEQLLPYTRELNRAVAAVAAYSTGDHPLTTEVDDPSRAALVVLTSDRGLNGAYSNNVLKDALRTEERLKEKGLSVNWYVSGRKGISYLTFRDFELTHTWEGFSASPSYRDAINIADRLINDFLLPADQGGVDEIHFVYTRFESMLTQQVRVRRILPLEIVDVADDSSDGYVVPPYEFEPNEAEVLNALLPLYVRNRVLFYLRHAAASQLAAQQKAMKSATDNAQQLLEDLEREANTARQAEITQEITEIVGGAGSLTGTSQKA